MKNKLLLNMSPAAMRTSNCRDLVIDDQRLIGQRGHSVSNDADRDLFVHVIELAGESACLFNIKTQFALESHAKEHGGFAPQQFPDGTKVILTDKKWDRNNTRFDSEFIHEYDFMNSGVIAIASG